MLYKPRPPFHSVRASCRTGWRRTGSLRKMSDAQTLQIWTRWTITFEAPCWKSTTDSCRSLKWLMSWKLAGKSYHKIMSTTWPRRTSPSAWLPTWLLLPTVTVSGECGRQTGNSSCHKTERRDSVRVGWPAERRPARGSQRFLVSRLIMQTDTCQCHRSHSNHRPKALIVNAAIRSAPLYIFHASLGRTLPAGACVWSYPESTASVTTATIKYLGTLVADRYRQV